MNNLNFSLFSVLYLAMILLPGYIVSTLVRKKTKPSFLLYYQIYTLMTGLYFLVLFLENSLTNSFAVLLTYIGSSFLFGGIIAAVYFAYSFGENYHKKKSRVVMIILLLLLALQLLATLLNVTNKSVLFNIKDQLYVNMGDFVYFLLLPLGNLLVSFIFFNKSRIREKETFPEKNRFSVFKLQDSKARTFAYLGIVSVVKFFSSVVVVVSEVVYAYQAHDNFFYFFYVCFLMIETLVIYQIVISSRFVEYRLSNRIISIMLVLLFILLSLNSTLFHALYDRDYDKNKFREVALLEGDILHQKLSHLPGDISYILVRNTNNILFDTNFTLLYRGETNVSRENILQAYDLLFEVFMTRYNDTNQVISNTVKRMEQELRFLNVRNTRIIGNNMVDLKNFYYCYYFERDGRFYEIGYRYLDYRKYLNERTFPAVMTFLFAFLIITFLLPLLFRDSVINPLNGLLQVIHDKESSKINPINTDELPRDEIGYFTGAFIEVVSQLQSARDRLSDLNLSLENKVDERTKELILARDTAQQATLAKSAFLAHMSHEIRTPLNAIINMNRLLMDTELDDSQREFNTTSMKASEILLGLINDVLDFSKIEAEKMSLNPVPLSLRETILSVSSIIKTRALNKSLDYSVNIDDDIPEVLIGDPVRLKQILLNLLNNAVKFTEEGEVKLSVKCDQKDQHQISLKFVISDSGIGISEQKQAQMFEPFYQGESMVHQKYGGTGLGLPITRNLVELMQGELRIYSEVNKGTTVSVILPFGIGSDSSLPTASGTDGIVFTGLDNMQVLAAEDNKFNRQVLTAILERFGIKPVMAENGKEALQLYENGAFDLVLMDLEMPEMDGVTAARKMRSLMGTQSKSALIAVSAYSPREIQEISALDIFDDYLQKPLHWEELAKVLYKYSLGLVSGHVYEKSQPERKGIIFNKSCLLERISHDQTVYLKLVEAALEDLPDKLARLKVAFMENNIVKAQRLVHDLKGFSVNICAPDFAEILTTLNELLKTEPITPWDLYLEKAMERGMVLVRVLQEEQESGNVV